MNHADKLTALAAQLKGRRGVTSLGKRGVSHFVPNPHDPRHRDDKLDVSELDEILDLDVAGRVCTAEPGVTFARLVAATLPHGLAPMLVPELETITIGGAVAGCAVESMAFRHGGFHDSCLEYELMTGDGELLRCAPDENEELFGLLHGSYGTLGILTKLKFKLIPAKPYVRLEYQRFDTFEAFHSQLLAACHGDADFVDAIVHGPRQLVLCLGRFVDTAPAVSSYRGTQIFYRSTLARSEDFLATADYFFRYDTDCHWATRTVPGLSNKLVRRLLGKQLLGSTNLLQWSRRLRPLLKHQKHLPVVIDLLVPEGRFAELYQWYQRDIGYYPLWIVPYRVPTPYPWLRPAHRAERYIDVAIYGLPNDRPGINYSKVLEEKIFQLGGVKTLISENHYDEATFWQIYDRDAYQRAKRWVDPQNLFRDLYQKFHFANPHHTSPAPAGGGR